MKTQIIPEASETIITRPYTVYCHTNIYNNKKYIGITCQQNLNGRWRNGEGYKYNSKFYADIRQFGWDSFLHEILFSQLSQVDAKQLERQLILEYDLTNELFGYNVLRGGQGTQRYSTQAEADEAQRISKNKSHQKKRKDPAYKALEEMQRKQKIEKIYSDQDLYLQYRELQNSKRHHAYNRPETKEAILRVNREYKRRALLDPVKKQQFAEASHKSMTKVNQVREQLKLLYAEVPNLFLENEVSIVFAKHKGGGAYVCNSYKKLSELIGIITKRQERKEEI